MNLGRAAAGGVELIGFSWKQVQGWTEQATQSVQRQDNGRRVERSGVQPSNRVPHQNPFHVFCRAVHVYAIRCLELKSRSAAFGYVGTHIGLSNAAVKANCDITFEAEAVLETFSSWAFPRNLEEARNMHSRQCVLGTMCIENVCRTEDMYDGYHLGGNLNFEFTLLVRDSQSDS